MKLLLKSKLNIGFCGEGKNGVPGEKPLGAEKRIKKLNPHTVYHAESGNQTQKIYDRVVEIITKSGTGSYFMQHFLKLILQISGFYKY